jgi:peptide/nickel transport system substrate-binding protein
MERTGKFGESPMLTAMVEAGELPSVEERLPPDPMVLEVVDEIGKYGGTVNVFAININPWNDFGEMGENGPSYYPYIFTDVKLADDFMSLTAAMRPGIKWSDGEPLTMEDVLFSYNSMHAHPDVRTWGMGMGYQKQAVAVDEWTVRFEFKESRPWAEGFKNAGAYWGMQPKHYLEKWHIDYNPDADKVAADEGYESWKDALYHHYWWAPVEDIKKPVLNPWVIKQMGTTLKISDRNPYYFVVDEAGNQLPYIDKVVSQVVDQEVYNLKIVTGESDVAFINANFENISLYKQSEESGDYTVTLIQSVSPLDAVFSPNFTTEDLVKREVINNDLFRRALSVAINRDEINEVVYFGYAVPTQATVGLQHPHYREEWSKAWAQYDIALANSLLDEIGLTKRDSGGFRLGPDGKDMIFTLGFNSGGSEEASGLAKTTQLVKEYWEKVGVRVLLKPMAGNAYGQAVRSNKFDISTSTWPGIEYFTVSLPFGALWQRWLVAKEDIEAGRKKAEDFPEGLPGEEPPQWVKDYRAYAPLIRLQPKGTREFTELVSATADLQAEKLVMIGTVGQVPWVFVAKNNVGNTPKVRPPGAGEPLGLARLCQQMYFK